MANFERAAAGKGERKDTPRDGSRSDTVPHYVDNDTASGTET